MNRFGQLNSKLSKQQIFYANGISNQSQEINILTEQQVENCNFNSKRQRLQPNISFLVQKYISILINFYSNEKLY